MAEDAQAHHLEIVRRMTAQINADKAAENTSSINNGHKRVRPSGPGETVDDVDTSMMPTPTQAFPNADFELDSSAPATPRVSTMAGQKRRLSSPPPSDAAANRVKVYLTNNDFPQGTVVEVPAPDLPSGLYMPAVRPVHPNPALTTQTLNIMQPGITFERYRCAKKCRNQGTCVHYHFVLGARRTADGLICAKCSQLGTEETAIKGKRLCPFHESDSSLSVNPIANLPCDYLATPEQRDRMVEILERAWRNEWSGRVEEVQYAAPPDGGFAGDVAMTGAGASAADAAGQTLLDAGQVLGRGQQGGKTAEKQQLRSAPAAMQNFRLGGYDFGLPSMHDVGDDFFQQ